MRKIIAFLLCSTIAFTTSFSAIPESFNLIIGWLSPVFGTSLRVLFSMLFILLGDPLKYTAIAVLWSTVGLLCGLIVRRKIGSILSAWLVYGLMFLILGVAALRLFEVAVEVGITGRPENMLALLPPFPPGFSLPTLLGAPIIGEIYARLQGLPLTSLSSPMSVISPIISVILLNALKNILILFLTSLVGCEFGKLVEESLWKLISEKVFRMRGKEAPEETRSETEAPVKMFKVGFRISGRMCRALLLSSLMIVISTSALSSIIQAAFSQDTYYYAEGIFFFATPDGTISLASAFVDSEISIPGVDLSSPDLEGALMGVLISQDTRADALPPILSSPTILSDMLGGVLPFGLPPELMGNLTRYYEIVPRTVFMMVYSGVSGDEASRRAESVASMFSSAFHVPLSYLTSTTQSGELDGTTIDLTFVVYQSAASLSDAGPYIADLMPVERRGIASFITEAYEAGIFTPGSTSLSSNGTVMAVGFFSSAMVLHMLENVGHAAMSMVRLILPEMETPIPMLGLFSFWINRLHSSSFEHTLNITKLLNITKPIEFSPEAVVSVISMVASNATIEEGEVVSQTPVASLILSTNLTEPELQPIKEVIRSLNETIPLKVETVKAGVPIPAEFLSINFTQILPLDLTVKKTSTFEAADIGQRVKVTITIVNRDTDPAENVKLEDGLLLSFYRTSVRVVEGSLTKTWPVIPGNSSVTHNYTLIFQREGIYTIPPALVTYNYMNRTFTRMSNSIYITVRGPTTLNILTTGIPAAWNTLSRAIDRVPGLKGSGSTILASTTLIIVGVIAFNEYRNVRRWLKARKEGEEEAGGKTSEA